MPDQPKLIAREAYDQFLNQYRTIHDVHRPDIDYQDGLAASAVVLALNAIIIINAGALVALSQLKDTVNGLTLWLAAMLYLIGPVAGVLATACQVWNSRMAIIIERTRSRTSPRLPAFPPE